MKWFCWSDGKKWNHLLKDPCINGIESQTFRSSVTAPDHRDKLPFFGAEMPPDAKEIH